jgi:5-methylcytosine-specific restriction endonuclease McrA
VPYDFDSLRFVRCDHKVPHRIRVLECKDARQQYYLQCERCGSTHTNPIAKQLALELLNGNEAGPVDRDLRYRYWRSIEEHRTQNKHKWRAMYDSYMLSREWSEKRRAVIARDNGVCQRCEDAAIEQVHHLTYERIGNERLDDLIGLCAACHAIAHGEIIDLDEWE